jgi:hypothetical protein
MREIKEEEPVTNYLQTIYNLFANYLQTICNLQKPGTLTRGP